MLTLMSTCQNCRYQCLCPCSESQPPPPPKETLQYHQEGLAQSPMRSLPFSLGPGAHGIRVRLPRVESLFPPALLNSCHQTLLAFKARFSGGSSSYCQTPRLGSLMWDSGLSLLWENVHSTIILQFVGCQPGRYGI